MSSNIPVDLCYSESHEWARANDDGTVTIGITDHAQHLLGDLVFVEIPEVGRAVAAAEAVRWSSRSRPLPTSTARWKA